MMIVFITIRLSVTDCLFKLFQSATVIGLARYHLMSVMPLLGSAIVVKCTLPDSVISVVRDSTVFLNVKVGSCISISACSEFPRFLRY